MKFNEVISKVNAGKHIIYKPFNTLYEVKEKKLNDGRKFIACINPNDEQDYASVEFVFEHQQALEQISTAKKNIFDEVDIKSFVEI